MAIDTQLIKRNTEITDHAASEEYAHTPVVQHFEQPMGGVAIRTDCITPRGSAEFPFRVGCLPYLEFIYIMSGDINLSLQDGPQGWNCISMGIRTVTYNTEISGIVTINSCAPIRDMHLYITPQKLAQLLGHGNANLVQTIIEHARQRKFDDPNLTAISPTTISIIHQIFNRNTASPADSLFLKGKVLELLAHEVEVLCCPPRTNTTLQSDDLAKLQAARTVMMERISAPPTIPELAREVGLNEKKIKRGFKELYGTTVYGFLRDYRMKQAKLMFDRDQKSVTDVACAVGYSNVSHFGVIFRHHHGVRPGEYLRSLREDRMTHHMCV